MLLRSVKLLGLHSPNLCCVFLQCYHSSNYYWWGYLCLLGHDFYWFLLVIFRFNISIKLKGWYRLRLLLGEMFIWMILEGVTNFDQWEARKHCHLTSDTFINFRCKTNNKNRTKVFHLSFWLHSCWSSLVNLLWYL